MSPIFCFIQLLFYYPFFFFLLYIYLIFFIPIKNTVNIANIFSLFPNSIKSKFNFTKD
jgi:hypothetical protein